MIPLFAVIRVRGPRRFSLYLPLFLLWILLLPFALVILPVAALLLFVRGRKPLRTLAAGYGLLSSMRGTHVDVTSPDASIFVHVY